MDGVKFRGKVVTRHHILSAIRAFDAKYPNTNDYKGWLEKGSYKYARRSDSADRDEVLYRMPDETKNLVRELPEVAQARRESLDRWQESVSRAATEEQRLSPEEREALEALGYGE